MAMKAETGNASALTVTGGARLDFSVAGGGCLGELGVLAALPEPRLRSVSSCCLKVAFSRLSRSNCTYSPYESEACQRSGCC